MSSGHNEQFGGMRTPKELAKMMEEGDTAKLAKRRITVDCLHDVSLGFGISVDAHMVYGDRCYVDDIRSGRAKVSGMSADQVIAAHVCHEITEKAVADGDNPVDLYEGAHPFGEAAEHEEVRRIRGDDHGYEEALSGALARCYARYPEKPPLDLWCGPLRDEASKRDKELLRILRVKGVTDAHKMSKRDAAYCIGMEQCRDCVHYGGGTVMDVCDIVGGMVRADRQCDRWSKKK